MNKIIRVPKISLKEYHDLLDKGYTVIITDHCEDKVKIMTVVRDKDNTIKEIICLH